LKSKDQIISPQLVFGLVGAIGFSLSFPAFNSDYQYRKALTVGQVPAVEKALTSSYMTPSNSRYLVEAAGTFANSNLPDFAQKYAREAIEFNPDYFDAWRILYSLPNSTADERKLAKENLIRLDPLNQEWKALP
jgi:hypothetical protein